MTNEELTNKVNNLRFKHATNQLSNPMVLEECKKNIARAKTVLRQRELGISVEPEKAAKKSRARKKA